MRLSYSPSLRSVPLFSLCASGWRRCSFSDVRRPGLVSLRFSGSRVPEKPYDNQQTNDAYPEANP